LFSHAPEGTESTLNRAGIRKKANKQVMELRTCIESIGLLGKDGGSSANLLSKKIIIPSNSTARIQEIHILIGHMIVNLIEYNLILVA